jgi:predicted ATP-grasp superfamily ATP-dependent carboligase
LSRVVISGLGLRGLVGIDFILRNQHPWLVEINPRYTASVEVLELALGRSLLADHCRVFDPDGPFRPVASAPGGRRYIAKRIVFAPMRCRLPDDLRWDEPPVDGFEIPLLADIPRTGEWFERGEPVVTLMASGSTSRSCISVLAHRAALWERELERLTIGSRTSPPGWGPASVPVPCDRGCGRPQPQPPTQNMDGPSKERSQDHGAPTMNAARVDGCDLTGC